MTCAKNQAAVPVSKNGFVMNALSHSTKHSPPFCVFYFILYYLAPFVKFFSDEHLFFYRNMVPFYQFQDKVLHDFTKGILTFFGIGV